MIQETMGLKNYPYLLRCVSELIVHRYHEDVPRKHEEQHQIFHLWFFRGNNHLLLRNVEDPEPYQKNLKFK